MIARGRWIASAFALALLAGTAAAQEAQPPAQPPAQAGPPETELVFEREVYQYPSFARRNPFRPLIGDEGGPRYEDIALRGVIISDDPRESVALLGLRQRAEQQAAAQAQRQLQAQQQGTAPIDTIVVREVTQRLRVGDSWGNVRVVQILRDHVIVNVEEFGLTEQRILRMPTRVQGGL
jgi:hypothetical protein